VTTKEVVVATKQDGKTIRHRMMAKRTTIATTQDDKTTRSKVMIEKTKQKDHEKQGNDQKN
jgi:hypothetical protein